MELPESLPFNRITVGMYGLAAKKVKNTARGKLQRAIERGEITRPTICEFGCENQKIEAHHLDYRKPFDVQWLCRYHHNLAHGWRTNMHIQSTVEDYTRGVQ